jgi:hypothetical protein
MAPLCVLALVLIFLVPSAAGQIADYPAPVVKVERPQLELTLLADGSWWAGNTHAHTVTHDADAPRPSRATANHTGGKYQELGFSFLVVTDHDWVTALPQRDNFTFIHGIEVSTNRALGFMPHVVGIDASRMVPWVGRSDQAIIDDLASQGALAVLAHPNWWPQSHSRGSWVLEDARVLERYHGIEMYNYAAGLSSGRSSPWALDTWYAALAKGRLVWGFSVDDVHRDGNIGYGYIVAQAPTRSAADIVDSMRNGRFISVVTPVPGRVGVWPSEINVTERTLTVSTAVGRLAQSVEFYDARGLLLASSSNGSLTYTAKLEDGVVLPVLRGFDGSIIYLQPLRVTPPKVVTENVVGSDFEPADDEPLALDPNAGSGLPEATLPAGAAKTADLEAPAILVVLAAAALLATRRRSG